MAVEPNRGVSAGKLQSPQPVVLEYAEDVARRVSDRKAPIRTGFIEQLDSGAVMDPPLARILRGGQGGAVRLKVLLSMLWFAGGWPHDTSYPARGWAGLLGLPEFETNGARRVSAAIEWLEQEDFVGVRKRPGVPSRVRLLDERGTGEPYELPFAALDVKREANEPLTRDDYYVTLPHQFWTQGWISILKAPAVAMLLVMIQEAAYSRRTRGLWHSPAQAKKRFGLSQDTRTAGLRELVSYRIVDKRTGPVSPGVFDMKRRRNIYDLHLEQLTVPPGQKRPQREVSIAELSTTSEGTDAQRSDPGADDRAGASAGGAPAEQRERPQKRVAAKKSPKKRAVAKRRAT